MSKVVTSIPLIGKGENYDREFERARCAASQIFGLSTVPLYRADESGVPEQIGSGTLALVRGRRLLITAAHVVDDCSPAVFLGVDGFPRISTDWIMTEAPDGDRLKDKIDLAATELDDATVASVPAECWLTEEHFLWRNPPTSGWTFTGYGYPATKNRRPFNRTRIRPSLLAVTDTVTTGEAKGGLPDGGKSHLILKYEKFLKAADGTQVHRTAPQGMSGGPLVIVANLADPEVLEGYKAPQPKFVGVMIEDHKKTVLATGAVYLTELIGFGD